MNLKQKVEEILQLKKTYVLLFFFGLIFKLILFPVKTGDFVFFLEPWINFIKSHGYGLSLKYGFYNYAPSYIYILVFIAKLGLNPLFSVKIVSILFEYLLAFYIGRIALLKFDNKLIVWASMAIIPILPSVILNSSYLSQCDSIYSAFVVGGVYYALKNKQFKSVLFFGIAFAFKMQAVMLLPFYFIMLLRGRIKWYYFFLVPTIFIVSLLPAWFYGRPFSELLGIYLEQSSHYKFLTMNFPNNYIWINNIYYEQVKLIGLILTFIITLICGLFLSRKKYYFSFEIWIRLAFLSSICIPFILPGMHERYMYLGDVLGVLYFFVIRKNIHLPVGILLVSFYSYIRCSRFNDVLPMEPAFLIYLLVVIFTISDFILALNKEPNNVKYQK